MFGLLIDPFKVPMMKSMSVIVTAYRFGVYTVHGTGGYSGLFTVSNGGRSFPGGQIARRTIGISGTRTLARRKKIKTSFRYKSENKWSESEYRG